MLIIWHAIPNQYFNEILTIYNSSQINIKFTFESDIDCCIPFLDMVMIRDSMIGSITTRWYKKTIATEKMLHYQTSYDPEYWCGLRFCGPSHDTEQ